jgi:NADH-quinone oxidoreductase subunit K
MVVPLSHVLAVSFMLLAIGITGIFTRKDAITVFLSVELILNAANVAFIGFSNLWGDHTGQIAALVIIVVAAAEAAVGLAIVIRLSKRQESLELYKMRELKG